MIRDEAAPIRRKIMETLVSIRRLSFRITHHFLKGIESCVELYCGLRLRY